MPHADFGLTGSWKRWDVPNRVEWVYITLNGAGSGDFRGGRVEGRINVKGINRLYIQVGGKGEAPSSHNGGAAGYGGGRSGGDGSGSGQGGWGGGGCSAIRSGSTTGTIKAVAAGAGGYSGDLGRGGQGGQEVGESGYPAPGYPDAEQPNPDNFPWLWDYPQVGNATGGTQIQGGNGGTSSTATALNGNNGDDTPLGLAGKGGNGTNGGGGGGGGYRPGGGGQASSLADSPGGGGGAGSNYTVPVVGASSMRGEGSLNNGSVRLEWVSPPPANQPPNPPSEVKWGKDNDFSAEVPTMAVHRLKVSAKLTNQEHNQKLRLVAQYSTDRDFVEGVQQVTSTKVERNKRAKVELSGLVQDKLYYLRLYARDSKGALSLNYSGFTFWTNRAPTEPTLNNPGDNATISQLATAVFEWSHNDPDPNSSQRAFRLRWRRAATPLLPAGAWTIREQVTWDSYWTEAPNTFGANYNYEWAVATQDQQERWGPYSDVRSFFVQGESTPPSPESPSGGEAVDVTEPVDFSWNFHDPDPDETQNKADLRYRPVGATDWITVLGDTTTPGSDEEWTLPGDSFAVGLQYEWQVRTQDSALSADSQWSDSAYFWTVATPGINLAPPDFLIADGAISGSLGCGHHRVFVYDRGGEILRGEVTPLTRITWSRKRDDISNCIIDTNGFDSDCGQLLSELRSWVHELVVFRDGERVWEGPITRITYSPDSVEVEAKDVMAYAYRRIMRQGYNDAYRVVNGEKFGLTSVVERGTRILMNALAPVDPNVLGYLTSLNFPDDARQSRSVPDYSRTAWEEVDDLAATAGLDYTTVGRRIILWDTHRPLGRLPEMRDGDFSDPPVITEYGMLLATSFAVTNNNGIFGVSEKAAPLDSPYGMVEQLASAYGENEEESVVIGALTSAARTALEETLARQAERNIGGRYPTPLVVRVPDNSSINPEANARINELVPGVWIPLRCQGSVREFAQWQKLDLLTVEEISTGEKVMVTMSPAPNSGEDPDSTGGDEEA